MENEGIGQIEAGGWGEWKKCEAAEEEEDLIGGQPSGNVHGLKIGECVM